MNSKILTLGISLFYLDTSNILEKSSEKSGQRICFSPLQQDMERIHGGRRIYTAGGRLSKGGGIAIDSKKGN